MKELILSGNYIVQLDDADYDIISKMRGWYIHKEQYNNAKTNYATHDKYGRLHRYLLNITDPHILVDHIDRNGLNCQRSNLRIVTCSENKRNGTILSNNKFNFGGLSFEKPKNNRTWRIKVSYSTNIKVAENRFQQVTKSFGGAKYKTLNDAVRDAVLYRLQMMRKYGYPIDERSETIEKECLKDNPDMEQILGISFKDFQIDKQ